jgi:hypothetical protein
MHVMIASTVRSLYALALASAPLFGQGAIDAPSCSTRADSGGVRLVAPAAPELELGLALARFGRADHMREVHPVEPSAYGAGFVYERGAGLREHWVGRATGVEFFLEFDRRPVGTGDLIARYALTEPAAHAAPTAEGGVMWSVDGVGQLSIGALTIVDATGAAHTGSISIGGGELELRVPAALVDSAVYPLRLDPLIGSATMISQPHPFYDNSAKESDIAHDAGLDRYLVVWREPAASSGFQVLAYRLDMNGAKVGSVLTLATGVAAQAPKVGALRSSGQFAVAWQEGSLVRCRLIRASDGALSSTVSVSSSTASNASVDVSGDSTGTDDDALVVWRNASGTIRGAQISTSSGTPTLLSAVDLVSKPLFGSLGSLSISKAGGAAGRHCLVWEARAIAYPNPSLQYLSARLFDRDLAPIGSAVSLTSGDALEEAKPDVDGNGSEFVVVYSKGPQNAYNECWARSVRHSSGALATYSSETKLSLSNFRHDLGTAVAFTGTKAYALWVEQPLNTTLALRGRGLAPNGCVTCENTFDVNPALPYLTHALPAVAGETGSADEDRFLATWQTNASGPRLTIYGRPFEAFGPGTAAVDLGGACGSAGAISTTGLTAPGYPSFQVRLDGAELGATYAVLWQSTAPYNPITCGTCVSEASGLSWLHSLSAGSAVHNFSIPCNVSMVGTTARFQWKVYGTSSAACAQSPGLAQTSRLECTFTQ